MITGFGLLELSYAESFSSGFLVETEYDTKSCSSNSAIHMNIYAVGKCFYGESEGSNVASILGGYESGIPIQIDSNATAIVVQLQLYNTSDCSGLVGMNTNITLATGCYLSSDDDANDDYSDLSTFLQYKYEPSTVYFPSSSGGLLM